jgi:hypothetical protein
MSGTASLLYAYYQSAQYFEWSSLGGAAPSVDVSSGASESGVDPDVDADEGDLMDEGDVGETACDQCISMDGFYDQEPERPHPGCDCQIVEHFNLDIDWEDELRNPQTTEGEIEEQLLERVTIDNGGSQMMEGEYSESHTVEGSIEVSATIEEVFSVSSTYSESYEETVTFSYSVPPGATYELEVYGQTQPVTFEGDLWVIDPDTGVEVFVDHISETIESAYGIHAVSTEEVGGDD